MENNSNTFLALLVGGTIGTILGILYAPDKGSETRRKIAERTEDSKDSFLENAADLKEMAKMNYIKKKSSLDNTIESLVSDASFKADDLISTLEGSLADLKMKNKKLQKK